MIPDTGARSQPADLWWLPESLRPHGTMNVSQSRAIMLVGVAALFAGYDMNIFGLALPQIQSSLHIPEDKLGLTVSTFRLAVLVAVPLVLLADFIGRRRLLLCTLVGQGAATLASGLVSQYNPFVFLQFLTRVFGYTEEMLCYVVIAEVMSRGTRGWAIGTLATLNYLGAGFAAMLYGAVTVLPYGWHFLFVMGVLSIFWVVYMRRYLPETGRFQARQAELSLRSHYQNLRNVAVRILTEHGRRLLLMMSASAAFGFALWPALVMGPKYMQSTLHFTPLETTLLIVFGGGTAAVLNIAAGRLSDYIGRRSVLILAILLALIGYGTFFGGIHAAPMAFLWPIGFLGFLTGDALLAGLATELFPTAYRATVSGLRYMSGVLAGAVSLTLEGVAYDGFNGGHGLAVCIMMLAAPVAVFALSMLPEPAGRELEEISASGDKKRQ